MALRNYRISSILGGHQPTETLGGEGQFKWSQSIDPDVASLQTQQGVASSGVIKPVAFDGPATGGSSIDDRVVAIVRQPQTSTDLIYLVLKNGKIFSYEVNANGLLSGESSIGTVAGGNAEGAFYYNDYLYITGTGADKDDISRYGKLSDAPGSASIADNVWKGSTLGTQPAMANHDMPGDFPKHWGHVHTDGQVYFADFVSGQGVLHAIKTDTSGANDGTEYNVLDLPFGYRITCIESFGTDLIIGAVQTTSSNMIQGRAAIFLWDTTNDVSFYRQVEVPAPFISAMLNKGGSIYCWYGFSADDTEGTMVGTYNGGYRIQMLDFDDNGRLPLAGAVASYGDRVVYANDQDVYALGYKNPRVGPSTARHSIGRSQDAGANDYINALAFVAQQSGATPILVIGTNSSVEQTRTNDANIASKPATWQSEMITVGQRFKINKVAFSVQDVIDANTDVDVNIYLDTATFTIPLRTINNTNFSESNNTRIVYKEREISESGTGDSATYVPATSMYLEFVFNSSDPIRLPIDIQVDTIDD